MDHVVNVGDEPAQDAEEEQFLRLARTTSAAAKAAAPDDAKPANLAMNLSWCGQFNL